MEPFKPAPAQKPRAREQRTPPMSAPIDRRDMATRVPMTRQAPAAAPAGYERGNPPPSRGMRAATFNGASYNAENRTVEAVFSSGAEVRRWFGSEILEISADAVDLARVGSGLCPFLNAHNQYDIDAVIGRVLDARIEGDQLVGTIVFAETESGRLAEGMVQRGELVGISIGYSVREWTLTEQGDAGDTWTATSWELLEVSLVPVPADPSAGVRSAPGNTTTSPAGTAATTEEEEMLKRNLPGGGAAAASTAVAAPAATPAAPVAEQRAADPPAPAPAPAPADTRQQVAAITPERIRSAAANAGLGDDVVIELLSRHVTTPMDENTLMADIGRRFAERDSGARTVNRVPAAAGNSIGIARAMEDAVFHRMASTRPRDIEEHCREFRGMGLLRLAEELLASSGINTRGMAPNEIAERALHTTSDFPALMSNALGRRLRAQYEENQPSYQRWARRAPNAPNFKAIDAVQLSAMPDFLKVGESGEVRYGSISDGKVSYALATYGRIIGLTRQLLVNDDLHALDRIVTGYAGSAARLENRTVYGQLTGNGLFPDGKPLFAPEHGNLAAGGATISATTLGDGRKRMRKQKGLQNEELNLAPAYLLVPSDLEQLAYQFTSSNYTPTKPTDINEFRAGGRTAVEPIVEPVLDAGSTTAWYLAASNSQVDTVEYTYLEGAEGPQISSRIGFTVDGAEIKATLDFAAAVVDWRGLDKNPGA